MIKKSLLPMRSRNDNRFGECSFQNPHPLRERKIQAAANKKMKMIWHNDVPAYTNSAFFGVLRARTRLAFTLEPYIYEIVTTGQQSFYSVRDAARHSSVPLAWAFGAGKVGQSFLFQAGGAFREARVSYYDSIHALDFAPARAIVSPR